MRSIRDIRNLPTDDVYLSALEIENEIVWPLGKASDEFYDVTIALETRTVDIPEQQEYLKAQVDDLIRQLKEIRDKLEG